MQRCIMHFQGKIMSNPKALTKASNKETKISASLENKSSSNLLETENLPDPIIYLSTSIVEEVIKRKQPEELRITREKLRITLEVIEKLLEQVRGKLNESSKDTPKFQLNNLSDVQIIKL